MAGNQMTVQRSSVACLLACLCLCLLVSTKRARGRLMWQVPWGPCVIALEHCPRFDNLFRFKLVQSRANLDKYEPERPYAQRASERASKQATAGSFVPVGGNGSTTSFCTVKYVRITICAEVLHTCMPTPPVIHTYIHCSLTCDEMSLVTEPLIIMTHTLHVYTRTYNYTDSFF